MSSATVGKLCIFTVSIYPKYYRSNEYYKATNVHMFLLYLSCILEWYMHLHQLVRYHHSMKGFVMQLALDVIYEHSVQDGMLSFPTVIQL